MADVGAEASLNTGSEPFVFDPPAGFAAWASGTAGGTCRTDYDEAPHAAPIEIGTTTTTASTPGTFQSDATAGTDLVVLSSYESTHSEIEVELERSRPVTLVLSAYETETWEIHVGRKAKLKQVIAVGFNPQIVKGVPAGVPVTVQSIAGGDDVPACAFQWPYDVDGCDTQGLVDWAEAATCLPMKMFAGAYYGNEFTVR